MKFFNKLKSSIMGSVKEDLNSALGGKQLLFNSKISGALDDLISMKTGIQISNIPRKLTEANAIAAEARRESASRHHINVKKGNTDLGQTGEGLYGENEDGKKSFIAPENRDILKFPTDSNRFVDNWMIFRTVPRNIPQEFVSKEEGSGLGFGFADEGLHNDPAAGFLYSSKTGPVAFNKQYSIALFFPNGVKDTISVEYDTKDVGLADFVMNSMFGKGGESEVAAVGALGDMFQEAGVAITQKMISLKAMQEGIVANNPKFASFNGVTLRDHTYTFNLNPYNERDAQEITRMIHVFKMMALPATSAKNKRMKILPAEWSINFRGPILGHIEHPMNCFLSTVDVDYSGGKDMSFIERTEMREITGVTRAVDLDEKGQPISGTESEPTITKANVGDVVHYPNGITLTLTFKEILQVNRQRYVNRVAASAMGATQKDTIQDTLDEAYGRDNLSQGSQATEEIPIEEREYGGSITNLSGNIYEDFRAHYGRDPHPSEIVIVKRASPGSSYWSGATDTRKIVHNPKYDNGGGG